MLRPRGVRSVRGQRLAAAVIAVGRFAPAVRQHDPSVYTLYGVHWTMYSVEHPAVSAVVSSALTTSLTSYQLRRLLYRA